MQNCTLDPANHLYFTNAITFLLLALNSIQEYSMHALEEKKKLKKYNNHKKKIKIGLVSHCRKRLYGILENNNHSLIVSTLKFL